MKNKSTQRVLGIDPGARYTGYVVLDGKELIHYGVKTLKKQRPVQRLETEVKKEFKYMIKRFQPDVVVIEALLIREYENWCNLGIVTSGIKSIAKQNGIEVIEYSPKDVRKHICNTGRATKLQAAKMLVQYYPELSSYLDGNYKRQQLYWLHVFDSLGVAWMYLDEKT